MVCAAAHLSRPDRLAAAHFAEARLPCGLAPKPTSSFAAPACDHHLARCPCTTHALYLVQLLSKPRLCIDRGFFLPPGNEIAGSQVRVLSRQHLDDPSGSGRQVPHSMLALSPSVRFEAPELSMIGAALQSSIFRISRSAEGHGGGRARPPRRAGRGRHGRDPGGWGSSEFRGSTPRKANCPCTSAGDVEHGHGAGARASRPP
jgi:hypothetical protein